jgi:putative hemolysin
MEEKEGWGEGNLPIRRIELVEIFHPSILPFQPFLVVVPLFIRTFVETREGLMRTLTFEILFILLLIIANGVFAMSELAIASARKARLQQWANEGNARARTALELANDPNRFLATTQIGITLIGTLAGAYGGATIAEELAGQLRLIPWLAPYSDAIGLGIAVLGISYFSLIIGELAPKRLALHNPERIASAVGVPMHALSVLASPVVRLLSASTEVVLWVLRIRPSKEPPVTEEEIKHLIDQGTQAGVFEEAEQDMVKGVFRLGDRQVRALMTPRTDVVWLDLDDSPEENRRKITDNVPSRFPVCQGSLEDIRGVVQVKDLFAHSLEGQSIDLKAHLREPLFVPESISALKVLELFKESGMHIALVIDEYGHIQGLVTLNDILEAIVGDIPSAGEPVELQAVQREDGSWLLDGMFPVEKFKALFHIKNFPGEEKSGYQTLGGFVMMYMERIPSAGEHFEWGELRFEVMDMDGNRVDKVLVTPVQAAFTDADNGDGE